MIKVKDEVGINISQINQSLQKYCLVKNCLFFLWCDFFWSEKEIQISIFQVEVNKWEQFQNVNHCPYLFIMQKKTSGTI